MLESAVSSVISFWSREAEDLDAKAKSKNTPLFFVKKKKSEDLIEF